MNFEQWLKAEGYDAVALTPAMRKHLEAAFKAETVPVATAVLPVAQPVQPAAPTQTVDAKMAVIEAESIRREYVNERTLNAAQQYIGHSDRLRQLKELQAAAIADEKCDARAYDLQLLRFDRCIGPMVFAPKGEADITDNVLEAAICQTARLANVEKRFDERTLQAAHTHFRRGISLKQFLSIAAERNSGYKSSNGTSDIAALCRAAFRSSQDAGFYPSAGPTTITTPGILSNVANKFLATGFLYTEQAWRMLAKIRTANDFKQMSTYRLTGANKFEKVAPGGKIKAGTLSELSYTNQVDTYGKTLGLDRRDIRNDDLGALTGASDELGRGAGDSLNEIFWTTWLTDSTFFKTDKSNLNYDDGATDSVLSLAGLDNASNIFASQTKPDGTPFGIMPKLLVVPFALRATAKNLMANSATASAQTTATVTIENVWAGMYDVVASVYLQATAIANSSSTAWYLAADPNNVSAIEVAFLDGIETPIVETSEFDFDQLGMMMRAFFDFGIALQEYRAALKLKGAA